MSHVCRKGQDGVLARAHLLGLFFCGEPLSGNFCLRCHGTADFFCVTMEAIVALARQWVDWDPNPETRAQTVEMIERADEAELTRHFGSRLEFGTAGLRGPMGPGPNCMSDLTVLQAAQARIRLPASVDARSPRCYRCCRFLLMHHI